MRIFHAKTIITFVQLAFGQNSLHNEKLSPKFMNNYSSFNSLFAGQNRNVAEITWYEARLGPFSATVSTG